MRQVGSPIDSSSVESLCVRRIASWNAWSGNLAKSALGKGLDLGLPGAEPHGGYMRFDAESVKWLGWLGCGGSGNRRDITQHPKADSSCSAAVVKRMHRDRFYTLTRFGGQAGPW